jgi:hypothetical protein
MGKVDKLYVREIRDNLGRFPVWPPYRKVTLGAVGFYNGRRATFEWKHNLSDFGITLPTPDVVENKSGEFYTSDDAVSFSFSATAANIGEASFAFARNAAVAVRSQSLQIHSLPTGKLEKAIAAAIAGGLKWNRNWVIVTELYHATSFTTLISSGKKSDAKLVTSVPITSGTFDIADPTLGISLAVSNKLHYQAIAETAVDPFFNVDTLIFPDNGDPVLKKYGEPRWWWF